MKVVYKCKNTDTVLDSVDMSTFNGYIIQVEKGNKISNITEVYKNVVLAKISLRPSKTPLIHKVEYNGHIEYRYNNNNVSSVYYEFNDKKYGEYLKFDLNGILLDRIFYYEGKDVTSDIIQFLGYTDDLSSFKNYEFKEDELFNIMMKYGFYFRFRNESERDSSEFDRITEYCQHI
ncbi:hypothetical protein pEaSNUABM50_00060 [Erwinia phage pEa_SNUABM_50]|uniref:Uncharacterized protein n=4 Tax=Eneladusvirus BF TaxID=2560751 RepID=A0A7L8ZM53_9CAUD|nr:hypothetical protein FDH34_gp062 [Serratia phage BF]QOI71000.1 hypothetical protein pEaSNUABM12_00062 [Erwinia phage pEa_SNUABM_12]QOI71545.1 hypothetical protein pEaSNUABM47_00061 [Erwinia phage pEa_SNUABM_47]QOI72084.1 hypothetical protein pEaSNUABM50_00060 [Erwinia phage pEa_SNUABM_50]QXO11209.1 hypothetical protein pEaSNUABM19_00063 [Erwinia phage pEa_SNUABM_19]QXO11757.1 hypothetical protein pEaSNUABM44_00061 [Erwinia phage pEa_SNUABM_44]QXO12308.1 hypothetical protein pEaSNUABM49_000